MESIRSDFVGMETSYGKFISTGLMLIIHALNRTIVSQEELNIHLNNSVPMDNQENYTD